MIDLPLRIYISCSWKGDLDNERQTAEKLIKVDLLMSPVYPRLASPDDITSDYCRRLADCDIAIVLLGSKYSENVEKEFRFALTNDIPTLVFQKECEREEKLQEKIENLYRNVTVKSFMNIDQLEKEIKEAIIDCLGTIFRDKREIERAIKPLLRYAIRYRPKPSEHEYRI